MLPVDQALAGGVQGQAEGGPLLLADGLVSQHQGPQAEAGEAGDVLLGGGEVPRHAGRQHRALRPLAQHVDLLVQVLG